MNDRELFDERAAILEFDGLTDAKLSSMSEAARAKWRKDCERVAYWEWRRRVGRQVAAPDWMLEIVNEKAKLNLGSE